MTDYFKNIKIDLIGENLTDDSFLTEEGLRWTDKTEVELISGGRLGILIPALILALKDLVFLLKCSAQITDHQEE